MRQRETGEGRHSLQTNLFLATTVFETNCTSQGSTTGTICHEQRTRARSFYWAHCSSAAVEACPRDIWDKLASSSAAPHQPSLLQTDVAQSSRLLYFFTIFCTQDDLHLRNRKYEPCTWAVEVWPCTFVKIVITLACQTIFGHIAGKLIWIQDGADNLFSLLLTQVKFKMPIFWKKKAMEGMTTMFGKVPRTAAFEHLPGEVPTDRNRSPGNWDLPLFQDEFCGNVEHQHRYWAEPIRLSLLKRRLRERDFSPRKPVNYGTWF